MSPISIRLRPLGSFEDGAGSLLECFGCGAYAPRLARFLDDRRELQLLCAGCEADVLEELANLDGEND